jgi:uncharacterized ParB-like nuclease family protein
MDRLKVSQIETSGGTQMRAKIDQAIVAAYRDIIADLPPVDVFHDGTTYWLADGFHRYWAHHEEKCSTIDCVIHKGGKRDAILFAVGANAAHGLRRSDDDKRRAVQALLNDVEWAKWSDREIARRCGVGHPFVAKIRAAHLESIPDAPAPDAKNAVSDYQARKFRRSGKTHEQKPKKPAARPEKKTPEPPPSTAPAADRVGAPLPPHVAEAFDNAARHDNIKNLLAQVTRDVNFLIGPADGKPPPGGELISNERTPINRSLQLLKDLTAPMRPHAVCPHCKAQPRKTPCQACEGRGWLAKSQYEQVPTELRGGMKPAA